MSINKITLLGRLGQKPELKYTPNGVAVCSFTLATSEKWADKNGQKQERTEWHKIIVWGKLGELCNQYLAQGRQIYLEGSNQTRSWEDKNGQKKSVTEVIAKSVQFLDSSNLKEKNQESNGLNYDLHSNLDAQTIETSSNFMSEDIPF